MADALARTNMSTSSSTRLMWDPPSSILDILRADRNGELLRRIVRVPATNQLLYNTTASSYQDVNASSSRATTTAATVCKVALPQCNNSQYL